MFKVEFPLRDGLGSNDVTGKVLLNSFRSTQFQVIGMQLKKISFDGQISEMIYREKEGQGDKNTYSFDSRRAHVTHCEIWRERAARRPHGEDKCSQLASWAESASEKKRGYAASERVTDMILFVFLMLASNRQAK